MYNVVYIGLWLILSTIVIQFFVVTWLHRTQKRYKVGYIDPELGQASFCLLYTSPSPRDVEESRMPSSA